ncbi:ATP-binding cassette domain-containing protein [Bauldia sp.]|uniref:ATP-binding cassette domain-containing protein n=1 Tax=Bauldia sp. TaxID=2575872 RepID=UPI003BAC50F7
MGDNRLELRHLDIAADDAVVIRGVDLTIEPGTLHVLLGPNGSGKSSLLAGIMGLPPFHAVGGDIVYRGERINDLPIDARARLGLGMAFQRPPALDDVTVEDFVTALDAQKTYDAAAPSLDFDGFRDRSLNAGFSGGETKRWEVLKLALQEPQCLLFDEPESGVDLEHVAAVGKAVDQLVRTPSASGEARSGLVITHTGFILDYIKADMGHLMVDGHLVYSGPARDLFKHIQHDGYTAPAA